jgi:hypothetical protein
MGRLRFSLYRGPHHASTASGSVGTSPGSKHWKCTWQVSTGSSPFASWPKHRVPSALPASGAPSASVYATVMSTTRLKYPPPPTTLPVRATPAFLLSPSMSASPLVRGRRISPGSVFRPSFTALASLRFLFASVKRVPSGKISTHPGAPTLYRYKLRLKRKR